MKVILKKAVSRMADGAGQRGGEVQMDRLGEILPCRGTAVGCTLRAIVVDGLLGDNTPRYSGSWCRPRQDHVRPHLTGCNQMERTWNHDRDDERG